MLMKIVQSFVNGLKDSFKGIIVFFYVDRTLNERKLSYYAINERRLQQSVRSTSRSRSIAANLKDNEKSKLLERTFQCCSLNGGIYIVSVLFFHLICLPSMQFLRAYIFGEESYWTYVYSMIELCLSATWVLPIFAISKIVNNFWFQDIAEASYRYSVGRPQTMKNFSEHIADTLFSVVVQFLFLIQCYCVKFIPSPLVSELCYYLHFSLLYSLYAFEYKWINMGWRFNQRLCFIETNWPYFIGFGLPLSIFTRISSSLTTNGIIFSILFPLFIISGNEATPQTEIRVSQLKLFQPVVTVSNFVFRNAVKVTKTKSAKTQQHRPKKR